MFSNCSKLISLNFDNFNINNVSDLNGIFNGINKKCLISSTDLKIIKLK